MIDVVSSMISSSDSTSQIASASSATVNVALNKLHGVSIRDAGRRRDGCLPVRAVARPATTDQASGLTSPPIERIRYQRLQQFAQTPARIGKADAVPGLHLYPSSRCGVALDLVGLARVEVIERAPLYWPPLRRVIQAADQVKG